MRYMLESPYGRWSEDGSRFVYDLEKVAHTCGYTVGEVKAYGVIYCRQFRRTWQKQLRFSASATLPEPNRT
jgi:hypothetical protein